jgi:addiction module HigA family antidote
MSRFAGLFGGRGSSDRKTRDTDGETIRGDQRRQRMADAEVSLDELRADAAAMAGRPLEPSKPIHPGEILWEEFMKPLGVKAPTTAKALGVPRTRIERMVAGQTAVSPDTALRLSRAFPSTTPLFWLNLQAAYDLEMTEQEMGPEGGKALTAIRPFRQRHGGMAA